MVRLSRLTSGRWSLALAAGLVLALGMVPGAEAQTDVTTSRISGTVQSNDGSPLPGVTVEAKNTETGLAVVDVSDGNGFYRLLNLPTGTYTVSASLDGFATAAAENIRLLLGSTPSINFTLQPASVAETITVTASELPVVEVTNTAKSTTIQQEQIEALPSSGRDFKNLVLLTPETRTDPERGNLSISGQRGINTNVTVDGVDFNNAFFGGTVGGAEGRAPLAISQESIKEFTVITNGASVEFGRSGGGFVNVITKSGTNKLHGSAFYYNQPQDYIADFPNGVEPGEQEKEQYGGSLGGALVQDKVFYFVSYDNQVKSETIPINPAVLDADIFARYPVLASPNQYVQTQDGSVLFARLDNQITPSHRFMIRGNLTDYEGINGTSGSSSRTESYNGVEGLDTKAYVASYSGQFGPNILNDFNLNFIDEDIPRDDKGLSLPEIQLGGFRYGEVAFLPIATVNDRQAFGDTLTYLSGQHVFKGGFEYNVTGVEQVFRGNWRGVYIFNNEADLLAGRWAEYRQFGGLGGLTSEQAGAADFEQKETALFVQDQWFLRSNLTLSAGLRWESLDNPNGAILNPNDPGPNGTLNLTSEIPDAEDQISPRLGLSWAPDEKTAVRFSVGRFWSRTPALLWAQPFTANGVRGAQLSIRAQTTAGQVSGAPTDPLAPGWGANFSPAGVERVDFSQVAAVSTPSVFTVDPGFDNPYTDRVTLGAEREILPRTSLALDFVYAEGNQLQRLTDINRRYDGTIGANGLPRYSSTRNFAAYNAIITDLSDGESEYTALTATVQRRYAGSYSYYGAVTWSDDKDHDSNERNFAGIQAEDFNNLDLNFGPSVRDQEWKIVLNGLWNTPWWGLGVSGSFRFATGSPFTAIINADVNNDGVRTDRPTVNGQHFGRNSFRQPDFWTLDLRLAKSFNLGPGDVSLFLECFNCSDRANLVVSSNNQIWGPNQTPNATFNRLDDNSFIGIPRTFQLALRYDF